MKTNSDYYYFQTNIWLQSITYIASYTATLVFLSLTLQ